jgi:hypothetical protein
VSCGSTPPRSPARVRGADAATRGLLGEIKAEIHRWNDSTA